MHIAFVCVVPRSVRHGGCPSCGGCAGRSRGAGRAGPARQRPERSCSHSAHLGKKVKDETTTHRGRTRSNEPIIEGSRYKKVQKGRSKKVQGQATERRRAPPRTRHRVMAPDQTPKRRTPPLGPRPAATERYHDPLSVAELRYEILNTGESRSTRGTLLGRPTAILLGAPCSSRRRGVFGPGTITQTHNHVGVVEWSLFPGISICVLHMWLRVS